MADPSTNPPATGPLVLVVDDTPINRAVACMQLHQIGCRTLAVDGGTAAVAAVAKQAVDLVLMDCQMPGMDGFAATRLIRQALAPGRRLPILAVTGFDQTDDRERCLAAGMDDLLAKPLQVAVLRTALARWLPACTTPPATPVAMAAATGTPVLDDAVLASFDRLRPGSSAILLGIYLKDLAVVEAAIAQAIADGDLAAVARTSHKLKGASLTVGACALGAAMKELGQHAREGSLPACQEGWRLAKTLLADTRARITNRCVPAPVPTPWPSGRASQETFSGQRSRALRTEGLVVGIEAMPGPAMLLNAERQIITINGLGQRTLGAADPQQLIGQRPGEAFGCIHAQEGPDGCGTAPDCAFCGMTQAVMSSQRDPGRTVKEARLTIGSETGHALDLEVTATPISLDSHRFVLVALRDIADEKRRKVLERLFFHDVLNSAGGIHGLATQLAQRQVPADAEDAMRHLLSRTTGQLVDEIHSQRLLASAESGDLQVDLQLVDLTALLREVRDASACQPAAAACSLVLGGLVTATVRTDRVLFRRVLGNLVKNALEATPPGGTVTIGSRAGAGGVLCTVHNPGEMSPAVQSQLFQRSFTTKGASRGLGSWSARLLGERYLGGRLTFTSTAAAGTELVFTLPVVAP